MSSGLWRAGGTLFAAVPNVYATVFSGFYTAFVLFLLAFIFRAVSLEFRSKLENHGRRRFWDVGFHITSLLIGLLLGIVLSNLLRGIALTPDGEFYGGLSALIDPYSLLTGLTAVILFMMHGAIYLILRTEGDLRERFCGLLRKPIIAFIICFAITTVATHVLILRISGMIHRYPFLLGVPVLNILVIAHIRREIRRARYGRAFFSSCFVIVMMMILFGLGTYPHLVYSHSDPADSLTLYNAVSSPKILSIMLLIAGIGMPLVIAYSSFVYWLIRGKVKLDPSGY